MPAGSAPDLPRHFAECFSAAQGGRDLAAYMRIVGSRSAPKPDGGHPEKHHIVPREWLSARTEGFSFAAEDPANVVYLSAKDRLLALRLLAVIFLGMKDGETYSALVGTISRRYGLPRAELWRNPYMDGMDLDALASARDAGIRGRKTKYAAEYLEECRRVYREGGFAAVRERMGYAFTERALLEQFRRHPPPTAPQ